MAQKIFPRSLRSQKRLSQDFSFYTEKNYASLWAKSYELATRLLVFSEKNASYQMKRQKFNVKRRAKKRQLLNFLNTRLTMSNWIGPLKVYPILFKFAHLSFSKKYNPIQALRQVRRSSLKKKIQSNHAPFKKLYR